MRHLFGASGFSAMAGRQIPLRRLDGWIQPLPPPPAPSAEPAPVQVPTECPQGQILVNGGCQPAPSAAEVTTPPALEPAPIQAAVPASQPIPVQAAAPVPIPVQTTPAPVPAPTPTQTMAPSPSIPVQNVGPQAVLVQIPPPESVSSPCDAGAWLRSKPVLGRVRLRPGLF